MSKIIRKLEQFMCRHPRENQVRRFKDGRFYLECMDCGHDSEGIEVGR